MDAQSSGLQKSYPERVRIKSGRGRCMLGDVFTPQLTEDTFKLVP